jgi:hypothetical protein
MLVTCRCVPCRSVPHAAGGVSARFCLPVQGAPARMLCYALPMTIEEMRHETDHHRGMRGRILGGDGDGR